MKQLIITILLIAGVIFIPLITTSAQNIIIIGSDNAISSISASVQSSQSSKQSQTDSSEFNQNNIIDDSNIYNLPAKFNSADKIRTYLKNQGSFLSNYTVDISFEADDDLWNTPSVKKNLGQSADTKIDFSEFVWKMSQSELGNSCSFVNKNVCIDQKQKPINPAVILALIQRESGLIRGKNARSDPNSDNTKFLLDRSAGYLCTDSDNKTQSCYDQNPEWKYYKGLFRQVYYGTRLLLINARRCELGIYKNYRTGNTVNLDGENIKLENGFTCASYIYTPHILSQKALYRVYKEIMA